MGFFKHMEGEAAVVVERGVFKQVDVYERDGVLYAKTGGGFVRLMVDGSTTKAGCRLETISVETLRRDAVGRLCSIGHPTAKMLDAPRYAALLGCSNGGTDR